MPHTQSLVTKAPMVALDAVLRRMMQGAGVQTQTELAQVLEIGKAAISDAKRRGIIPAEWFLKLCRPPLRLNPLWLESGQEPMCIPRAEKREASAQLPQDNTVAEGEADYGALRPTVPVPMVRPSVAHPDHLELAGESPFAFDCMWLQGMADHSRACILRISGQAMHPSLREGDLVLLDPAQRDVVEGGVYLLRLEDRFMIKRLAPRPGVLVLMSDNSVLYPPLELPHPVAGLHVLGRITWLSRAL